MKTTFAFIVPVVPSVEHWGQALMAAIRAVAHKTFFASEPVWIDVVMWIPRQSTGHKPQESALFSILREKLTGVVFRHHAQIVEIRIETLYIDCGPAYSYTVVRVSSINPEWQYVGVPLEESSGG